VKFIFLSKFVFFTFSFSNDVYYFVNKRGIKLGVSNKLIIKTKFNILDKYLKQYNLKFIKQISEDLYLVKTKDKNLTLKIAKILNDKDDIQFAQADYKKRKLKR